MVRQEQLSCVVCYAQKKRFDQHPMRFDWESLPSGQLRPRTSSCIIRVTRVQYPSGQLRPRTASCVLLRIRVSRVQYSMMLSSCRLGYEPQSSRLATCSMGFCTTNNQTFDSGKSMATNPLLRRLPSSACGLIPLLDGSYISSRQDSHLQLISQATSSLKDAVSL